MYWSLLLSLSALSVMSDTSRTLVSGLIVLQIASDTSVAILSLHAPSSLIMSSSVTKQSLVSVSFHSFHFHYLFPFFSASSRMVLTSLSLLVSRPLLFLIVPAGSPKFLSRAPTVQSSLSFLLILSLLSYACSSAALKNGTRAIPSAMISSICPGTKSTGEIK